MEVISSKTNQYVKLTRSLREKKYRDQHGLYLAEGLRLAEEAVSAFELEEPVELAYALVSERALAEPRLQQLARNLAAYAVPVYQLSEELFAYCAETQQPQGVLLALRQREAAAERARLAAGPKSFWLAADGVSDPGNLGTILRAAWAAGADGAILLPGCVDRYNSKVVRASMGAVFNLPLWQAESHEAALALLDEAGVQPLVTAADGQSIYSELDLTAPVAWVLGAEATGVSEFWRQPRFQQVSLPMTGGAESLNVAMAASILFYETLRQRLSAK